MGEVHFSWNTINWITSAKLTFLKNNNYSAHLCQTSYIGMVNEASLTKPRTKNIHHNN
jgi:hypothetical protein